MADVARGADCKVIEDFDQSPLSLSFQFPDISGHDVGIYLGGFNVGMAEEFLEYPDIHAVFQHMGGKAVAHMPSSA